MKQRRSAFRLCGGHLESWLRGVTPSTQQSRLRLGATASRFARSNRGVAMLEFTLIAPFLLALLFGSYELTRFINTTRQISNLSNSIAQLFAQNTSGTITDTDLHFAIDSTMVTFPNVLGDAHQQGIWWYQDVHVTMSSVAFSPTVTGCTSNCTYNAKVMWTTGSRPCSTNLTPVADTATRLRALCRRTPSARVLSSLSTSSTITGLSWRRPYSGPKPSAVLPSFSRGMFLREIQFQRHGNSMRWDELKSCVV